MANLRIRSAVLAFFFGNLGVDMFLLGPHQRMLFLLLGGPLLAVVVVCGILSATSGGWAIVSGAALVFLEFWAIARFFEALSHTDESFDELLRASNQPAGQLDPATAR